MEFAEFIRKLPTTCTIFYVDPPVFDEAAAVLDKGLRRRELIRLSLKQLRAVGVHTKLMKLIKVKTSVNNPVVSKTISVCKKLLHHLSIWIGGLNVSYCKDYIPILNDICVELPSTVLVPGSVLTFDDFSKFFIQKSLVILLEAWANNLRDFPSDSLDSILLLTLIVEPRCLKSSKVRAVVNRLLAAVSFGCVKMYKVLYFVCVATENLDEFKVTITKNYADLQKNLGAYVTRWLNVDGRVPIEESQIFAHSWVLNYVSVMDPVFRRDLAQQLLPTITPVFGHGLEIHIKNSETALEDSVNFFQSADQGELNLTGGISVRLDPDAERAYGFGVAVDWFYAMSKELLDLHKLFEVRNEQLPNALYFTEGVKTSKLRYYTFFGRLVGLALTYSTHIAFSFSKCLHVLLADEVIDLEVLQEADLELYYTMKNLLTCCSDDFFPVMLLELDTSEYSSVEQRLKCINEHLQSVYVDQFKAELDCFREGLDEVLGSSCRILIFKLLKFSDLEPLLCGSTELCVDDWERSVVYGGSYIAGHDDIVLFWQIVREMTPRERLSLFAYWTSYRGLPIGGFREMPRSLQIMSMHGIDLDLPEDREAIDVLPLARTCLLQLRLPRYSSPDIMRSCLRIVVNMDFVRDSFGIE